MNAGSEKDNKYKHGTECLLRTKGHIEGTHKEFPGCLPGNKGQISHIHNNFNNKNKHEIYIKKPFRNICFHFEQILFDTGFVTKYDNKLAKNSKQVDARIGNGKIRY